MVARKSISRTFFVLLFAMFLLTSTLSVQAKPPARPLQSSGSFVWAKSMGGAGNDISNSIAIDSSGNTYTTGLFEGTVDFDPGAGIANLTSVGSYDIFVSKLDGSGNFAWAKSMGGTGVDGSSSIAVDSSSNVYMGGYFAGTADFDPGVGTSNRISAGVRDIFVSKLDSNGNFVWAKSMGGTNNDQGAAIAVDSSGNIHTMGFFQGTADFDPNAGAANLTSVGLDDIFVSKLDNSGNFVWAKSMGGTSIDNGYNIAIDVSGNVYTTGYYNGTADFDPGAGTANLTSMGSYDIFVSKLDINGNFAWAKSMGGTDFDYDYAIAVDSSGSVYTTGYFQGTADFDPGVGIANLISAGLRDIFISKLDGSGNFVWAKSIGGANYDQGASIVLDSSGSIYTTGIFEGTADFDPGAGIANRTSVGGSDIFVSKLDSNGNFAWAKSMGGTNYDVGLDIALDSIGNIYTTGYFQGTADFDPGAGTTNLTSVGNYDIFVSKLDDAPTFADVPFSYWASSYIERLYSAGITSGCSIIPLNYCPDSTVTRAQMAVFLLKGIHGSSYTPPTVGGSTGFNDVATSYWAAGWIKQLAAEGITSGCGTSVYCPDANVSRAQMAVFLLKAKYGSAYTPPAVGGSTGFSDVATNYWAAAFIKQLAAEGVTSGCGSGTYCPDADVTRAQMAVFLVKAFNLP